MRNYKEILIEKFIPGREIQVAVMGNKALGPIELKPKRKFYDYRAKYESKAKTQHIIPVDLTKESLSERVMDDTNGWGVDRFFECSGAVKAYESIFSCCSPGAHVVLIGNNAEPVPMNWAILFAKGLEYQTVHRYSHQYEPSIRLLGSGKIDVKPMITHTFKFDESVEAFERAAEHRPTDVKLQIKIDEEN